MQTLSQQDQADLWTIRQKLPADDPRRGKIDRLLISQRSTSGPSFPGEASVSAPQESSLRARTPHPIADTLANAQRAVSDFANSVHSRFGPGPKAYVEDARQTINRFLTNNAPLVAGGVGGMAGGIPGAALGGVLAGAAEDPQHPVSSGLKEGAKQAAFEVGGRIIPGAIGKGAETVRATEAMRPTAETVEGVSIPQLVGERSPDSTPGTVQRVMKKSGAGASDFRKVEGEQTAASKEAIRRSVSKSAYGPVVPMTGKDAAKAARKAMFKTVSATEPAEAAGQAVSTLENRAKPLYSQLAASRAEVPFDPTHLGSGPEEAAWKKAVSTLKVPVDTLRYPNKPLYLLQEYRRNLQKIALASEGTTEGFLAQEARKNLDADIEKSLAAQNPKLLQSWRTANALWARARAMDDVRGVLASVTKGTAPAEQSLQSGAHAVPTEIQGASLVEKLKKLDEGNHPLSLAFPDGGKSLRAVADMLDKAQRTRLADPSLFPWSRVLRYGAALAGATATGTAGFFAGRNASFSKHPGIETFAGAAVLAFIGQRYGEQALVRLMTDKEGSQLLSKLAQAKTTEQVEYTAKELTKYLPNIMRAVSVKEPNQ